MSSVGETKVADVITIPNIMCDNLYITRSRGSTKFTVQPEFTESNGLSGLLISKVSEILGPDLYNVDLCSLAEEVLPFEVDGSKHIRDSTLDFSMRLVDLRPEERHLSGVVDVTFHNVGVCEIQSFDFSVYNIAYSSVSVKLVSSMYYFHDHISRV